MREKKLVRKYAIPSHQITEDSIWTVTNSNILETIELPDKLMCQNDEKETEK